MLHANLRSIQQLMCFADGSDGCDGKVLTLESDNVNAAWASREAFGQHEWRHVLQDPRQSADKAVAADGCEVVNRNATAESSIVLNAHMPTEHDGVGHNHSIFDDAIMCDVRVGHEVAVVTDRRDAFVFFGTAIDGYAFAEHIAITDDDLCGRTLVGQILRLATDDTAWEQPIVSTDSRVPGESHTVFQACPSANLDVGADDTVVTDANVFVEFSARIDHGCMGDYGWHRMVPSRVVLIK